MLLHFLIFSWVETYPYNPHDSLILNIYDTEIEVCCDTIGHIEVSAETEEKDVVKMEKKTRSMKFVIGTEPKSVILHNFSGSYDNTKVTILHMIKIKLPSEVMLVINGRNSKCLLKGLTGNTHILDLLRTEITFDSCFTNIIISKSNSSNIAINQNKGRIVLEKIVSTPLAISRNVGEISIKKAVAKPINLEGCQGDFTIYQLQGDLNIIDCAGNLKAESVVGNIFILKENRKGNFGGVIKNMDIQL